MLRDNKGLSVIELMVGIGILAISAVVVFMPQIEIQKRISDVDKKASRIIQNNDLKQKILATETALSRSALVSPENDALCPCTQGGNFFSSSATKVCLLSQCQANQDVYFSFFDPKATSLTRLSGTMAAPVYYSKSGEPCPNSAAPPGSDPEKICGYKAVTKYRAHCPGDLSACDHADYLILTLELFPLEAGSQLKYEKTQFIYSVPLNYKPIIAAISDLSLNVAEQKKIAVTADAGDPSEIQKFIFQLCESQQPNVVEVKCYKFVNGVAQIILTGKVPGTTQVRLQINDGGFENNLSNPLSFNVTVPPPPP